MRYVPLHVHSEYSLLDGAIRNKELIKFSKENNFEAVAVTDHGVMYGALELYRLSKDMQFKCSARRHYTKRCNKPWTISLSTPSKKQHRISKLSKTC